MQIYMCMCICSYLCINMYVYTQDMEGYREWISQIKPGQPAIHPALPIVYQQ